MTERRKRGVALAVLALFVLVVLLLAGCAARMTAGVVTGKRYEPPYTTTMMMCAGYTAQGSCSVWVPYTSTYPERFVLELRDGEDTGSVGVSREVYEETAVGDRYAEPEG